MQLALMQPYFLPYIGYWQLMHASSRFIVHDKIEYSKGGWINRNRAFNDEIFTIPLAKHSDHCEIRQLQIANSWPKERDKLLRKIRGFYGKAKNFNFTYPMIEDIFLCDAKNLHFFIFNSILKIKNYLKIHCDIDWASETFVPSELKGSEMVKAYCQKRNASTYVNAIGGQEIYKKKHFKKIGVDLKFVETKSFKYSRGANPEIFGLSILDLLMYNHREEAIDFVGRYRLI